MNQLPPSTDEQMMPYIKQTKKSGTARAVFIMAIAAVIIACAVLILRNTDGGKRLWANFFGEKKEPVESETTTEQTNRPQKSIYDFDYSAIPAGRRGVVPADLSALTLERKFDNPAGAETTDDTFYLEKLTDGKVRVLIINTHPYEAYQNDVLTSYGEDFSATGGDKTVKEIGKKLALALIERGVGAEYLDTEITSGKDSYAAAREKLAQKLKNSPDVLYVFDLHRALTSDSAGNVLRPIAEKDEKLYAQMNFDIGAGNEKYTNNMKIVNALTERLSESFPTLVMPSEISSATLNQDIVPVVFTVEIGSLGNTFDEALNTAEYLANTFADMVK